VVDYNSRGFRFRGAASHWALIVRRQFFQAFLDLLEPGTDDPIVDIGVTPETQFEDTNFLERWYQDPSQITATSIEDASSLEQVFPGVTFVMTSGRTLPFRDRQFAISFSSAVVEHVGTRQQQREFIAEHLRVSGKFFLTTPNRWFPLELHTYLPLIHWFPQPIHQRLLRWCGKSEWAKTENLNLLSTNQLRSLFPPGCDVTVAGIRTLGFTSNLFAYGRSPVPGEDSDS
jgi:SAM-dependent methyltransferase